MTSTDYVGFEQNDFGANTANTKTILIYYVLYILNQNTVHGQSKIIL